VNRAAAAGERFFSPRLGSYVVFYLMHGDLWLNLRFALRQFKRNPAFSLTAILVIALGIGATTAVFSVVDRLLFRSLPYPDSDAWSRSASPPP